MDYRLFFIRLKAGLSAAAAVILIQDRKAVLLKGRAPASILAAFSDIAEAYAINSAVIAVRKSGRSTVLRFSGPVPDGARQRFRNVWFSSPERKIMGV
ncbi:MAG: DUF3634 family protein [Candidatus Sulfobium sp.]|jgi:hypothetical protein